LDVHAHRLLWLQLSGHSEQTTVVTEDRKAQRVSLIAC
jgi:hypothetical protein